MSIYDKLHCINADHVSIKRKVVLLRKHAFSDRESRIFYCLGGLGANIQYSDGTIRLVDLMNAEVVMGKRQDVMGIVRPEELTDQARLQISRITPCYGCRDGREAAYRGVAFLPDGRFTDGVYLDNWRAVMAYVGLQKEYQYRIEIYDRQDQCVFCTYRDRKGEKT